MSVGPILNHKHSSWFMALMTLVLALTWRKRKGN